MSYYINDILVMYIKFICCLDTHVEFVIDNDLTNDLISLLKINYDCRIYIDNRKIICYNIFNNIIFVIYCDNNYVIEPDNEEYNKYNAFINDNNNLTNIVFYNNSLIIENVFKNNTFKNMVLDKNISSKIIPLITGFTNKCISIYYESCLILLLDDIKIYIGPYE